MNNKQNLIAGLLSAFLLLGNHFVYSQSGSPEQQIDHHFAKWNNQETPGASIAVVKDGQIIFKKGYGSANLEYQIPNNPSTLFQIASVSKQVTAYAVLLLENMGKISLDDDVRKFVPEVPDFGKVITLRHLLLHTSGLREEWDLLTMAGWRIDDVITNDQVLKLIYRQKTLNFNPGDEHRYSNTGYSLLAEVVARVSGQSFAEFTHDQIFKPLQMTSTFFCDDHEKIINNRSYSYYYDEQGYKKNNLNHSLVGSSGLYTTVEDFSRWVMNFENPVAGNKKLIDKMNERGILNNGDTITYALGQETANYKGLPFICHGGADGGYRSFLARFPEQRFSVIVFSNNASFNPAGIALQVAEIYLKDKFVEDMPIVQAPAPSIGDAYAGDNESLQSYCGRYELRPGYEIYITAENNKLFVETTEIPKAPLTRVSQTGFALPQMNASLAFVVNQNGDFNQINIAFNNQELVAKRIIKFDAAAVNLDDFKGNFYSTELGTLYTFIPDNGHLIARHARSEDFTLTPTDLDQFTSGNRYLNRIVFIRDANNRVTGCLASGGRTDYVRFEKISVN